MEDKLNEYSSNSDVDSHEELDSIDSHLARLVADKNAIKQIKVFYDDSCGRTTPGAILWKFRFNKIKYYIPLMVSYGLFIF